MDEIEEFIKRRFDNEEVRQSFLRGNCYYFAKILQTRFPDLIIFYLPVKGHFCVFDCYNGSYYDVTGKIEREENEQPIDFELLAEIEPNLYKSIVRDCIM